MSLPRERKKAGFKSLAPIKRPLSIRKTSPIAKNLSCLHCATHDGHLDQALDLIKVAQGLKENTVDIPVLAFTILLRKMLHVSFPGLMSYIGNRTVDYDKAKALAPDNVDVLMICALQVAEGMFPPPPPEEPIAEFKKILGKDPKLVEAYYQIGCVWDKAKKTGEVRINYQKALELNSNHHWAKKKLQVLASGTGF